MYLDMTILIERNPNFPASSITHEEGHVHVQTEFITEEKRVSSNKNIDK